MDVIYFAKFNPLLMVLGWGILDQNLKEPRLNINNIPLRYRKFIPLLSIV